MEQNSNDSSNIITPQIANIPTQAPIPEFVNEGPRKQNGLIAIVVIMIVLAAVGIVIFAIKPTPNTTPPENTEKQALELSPTIPHVTNTTIPLITQTALPKKTSMFQPKISRSAISNDVANIASSEATQDKGYYLMNFVNTANLINSHIGLYAVFDNGKGYNIIAQLNAQSEKETGRITEFTFWAVEDGGPDKWDKNDEDIDYLSAQISIATEQKSDIFFQFKDDSGNIQKVTITKDSLDKAMAMPPLGY